MVRTARGKAKLTTKVGEAGAIPNTTMTLTLHCHHQNDIAIRWAAMRAILMFHSCGGQSHKTESI